MTELIRCHDDERDQSAEWWKAHAGQVPAAEWVVRAGRRHCTWCGSLHPVDLLDALMDVTPAPWVEPECAHGGHLDVDDWRACQDSLRRLSHGRTGLAEHRWTEGWPHKFTVHLPGGATTRFYCLHLNDLPERFFVAVSALISRHTGIEFLRDEAGRLCFTTALLGVTGP